MEDNWFKEHVLKEIENLNSNVQQMQSTNAEHFIKIYSKLSSLSTKSKITWVIGGSVASGLGYVIISFAVKYFEKFV